MRWAAILISTALVVPTAEGRDKIDEIVMDNGDRIICEIRDLERGILKVKPDYTKGFVYIEWIHVENISSSQLFEFEITDGRRLYGTLRATEAGRRVEVDSDVGLVEVDLDDIVVMAQIEEKFLDRTKGFLDVGLTALRANGQIDLNVGGSFTYRQRKYSLTGDLSSLISRRDDAAEVTHHNFGAQVNRYLKKRVFYQGYVGFQSNTELDLDLRAIVGGGVGRFFVESSKTRLSVLGGLIANREDYATRGQPSTSIEGVIQFNYQLFVFTGNKTKFSLVLNLFPGITESGRLRTGLDSNLYSKLVGDLYWSLTLRASTDNQPPEESQGYDWAFISSLRYYF